MARRGLLRVLILKSWQGLKQLSRTDNQFHEIFEARPSAGQQANSVMIYSMNWRIVAEEVDSVQNSLHP